MIEQVEGEKPFSQKNLKYYIEKKKPVFLDVEWT